MEITLIRKSEGIEIRDIRLTDCCTCHQIDKYFLYSKFSDNKQIRLLEEPEYARSSKRKIRLVRYLFSNDEAVEIRKEEFDSLVSEFFEINFLSILEEYKGSNVSEDWKLEIQVKTEESNKYVFELLSLDSFMEDKTKTELLKLLNFIQRLTELSGIPFLNKTAQEMKLSVTKDLLRRVQNKHLKEMGDNIENKEYYFYSILENDEYIRFDGVRCSNQSIPTPVGGTLNVVDMYSKREDLWKNLDDLENISIDWKSMKKIEIPEEFKLPVTYKNSELFDDSWREFYV